jgi:pimeloyl-ACP methyl ester carboxylesterase
MSPEAQGTTPPGVFPDGDDRFTVRWLRVGSWRVRCVECGPPEGPPLVMLHGWGCTAFTFRQNMPAFAAEGWRVRAIELPGTGWSDKPDDPAEYTLEALAHNAVRVLDALGLDSVPVIGQSLGGGIALQMGLDAPERVERLALWSPIGFGCTRLANLGAMLPVESAMLIEQLLTPRMVRGALAVIFGRSRRPDEEEVRQYFAPIESPGFVRAQIQLLRNVNWDPIPTADRAKLTMRILLLTGTEDRLVPLRCLTDAAGTLPDCRLHTLPGAGHGLNETHPEAVNKETIAFLRVPDAATTV